MSCLFRCTLREYRRFLGVGLAWLCLWLAVVPLFAQNLQDMKNLWQRRPNPDRWEGLKPIEIAGERIDLLAVFLQTAATTTPSSGETSYYLSFYLPQTEPQVHIAVRDYQSFPDKYHYWMVPERRQYNAGFQQFAWEATVLRELKIPLQGIGAVARVSSREHSSPVVAPLVLSSTPLTAPIRLQGCRFVFQPSTSMRVDYFLYPKGKDEDNQALLQGKAQEWSKEGTQTIAWNGKDTQKKDVAAGWYGLRVRATTGRPGGALEPPLLLDWLFYYTPEIRG